VSIAYFAKKSLTISSCCGRSLRHGFYRVNPSAANLITLALECAYIGLGGGILLGRVAQLFLRAVFFTGRIDVLCMSKHIADSDYLLDRVSTSFIADMLVHEAHRHPYMERLLALYMTKLKNDNFGSDAGACWRQLFVLSLMPWLAKYRVANGRQGTDEWLEDYNTSRDVAHRQPMKNSEQLTNIESHNSQGVSTPEDEESEEEFAA